jgi:hypothetical protein
MFTTISKRAASLLATGLLALSACADNGPLAHKHTVTDQQFAAGWQENARPLYNRGPGIAPGTNKWWVPSLLPKGNYVLINRVGNGAELIDGFGFEVTSSVTREIYLMVPIGYNDVEAMDEKYVNRQKPVKQ